MLSQVEMNASLSRLLVAGALALLAVTIAGSLRIAGGPQLARAQHATDASSSQGTATPRGTATEAKAEAMQTHRPVDLVDPFIGSAHSRWFYFSSASRPFGMVNLSPDTEVDGAWGSGYRYRVDTLRGFSHIHAWQLSGISVLPVTGAVDLSASPEAYAVPFSHENEEARPGYHTLSLPSYGVRAELTSTLRVGFHRYTFAPGKRRTLLFNLGGKLGPSEMTAGPVQEVSDTEIEGYTINQPTIRRPKPTSVYFVAQFDRSFERLDGWRWAGAAEGDATALGGAALRFGKGDAPLLAKVGISYVSVEQARKNLEAELPHWNFEQVVEASAEAWNEKLSRIEVEGGTHAQQVRFYTDLWHALQGRRVVSDASGTYIDNTGPEPVARRLPLGEGGRPAFRHYNSDSFWGAQWTLNTLWPLVYPGIAEGFVNSMVQMYKDGGLIPRGPSGGNYTYVMTGASSTPFIVSAYMKGLRGFDVETAYEGLRKNHLPGGIMGKIGYEHETQEGGGLEAYIDRGYVPYPLSEMQYGFHQDGAGQTLEYAYQDWTLAQMARELGHTDDYERFMERADNYRALYDENTAWMRPRTQDGSWLTSFEPLAYKEGFVEANASQGTWFVPHDVQGLIGLMGGREVFRQRLNRSFEKARAHDFVGSPPHLNKYVDYGNQPSMQVAYLFNYAGAPWMTQHWSREVIRQVYSGVTSEEGYHGDEDQGLMGSLAVLMKMGLFSMRGGSAQKPVYEVGSPIFDEITLHLDEQYYTGRRFTIETQGNSIENRFIQSAALDGQPLRKPWFYHDDLVDGGTLVLEMGSEPNESWGSRPQDAPPSMSTER